MKKPKQKTGKKIPTPKASHQKGPAKPQSMTKKPKKRKGSY
jgi:hypothetical protein